ncbi:MAG: hypothetical protein IJ587_07885, partial [Synergistaceae bacterium]|nr:hypothetical protein [Synergistaceae bacterium]
MKIRRVLIFSLMVLMFSEPSYSDEAVRIGIMRFNAKASGVSSRHTEAISDELTRALANSYSIAVVDRANFEAIAREQRLSLSGLIDSRMAARIGRLAGIQYMIFGAVTRFGVSESVERSNNSGVVDTLGGLVKVNSRVTDPFKQEKARKTETAEVTLDASVVDVNTGEVVLAISETGTARRVISGQSSGRGLRESSSSSNISLQEEAISDAVARIGQRIKEAVVGEYPQVLSAEGRDIILGIGATSGVRAGNLYKISSEGAEIFDMQGNVVGRRVTPVAIVRVEDVQNNYSVARVVRDGGNPAAIRRGDRIEAVSQSEANELMRGNAFHRRRPPKPPMPREYASYHEPVPAPEPEP